MSWERQQRILDFLHHFLAAKGYPPTIREIARGCSISSTSVVEYYLKQLEGRRYIRRDREVSRGMKLTSINPRGRLAQVPLIGYIAAGEPIPVPEADAWNNPAIEMLELPQDLTRNLKGVYALKVKGTSMVDALINDSDLLLMQSASTANNGDTVAVWLKKEREATLKKFYQEQGRVRLQPANSQLEPIYTDADNVEIQGKVIGVIRQLG